MHHLLRVVVLGIVAAILAPIDLASAQPLPLEEVPEALRPWVPWVLDGQTSYGCTWVEGQPVCVWPGELRLVVDAEGGRFEQRVTSDRKTLVPLPGDRRQFPQDVRVDGQLRPVVDVADSESPHVEVEAGTHRIEGSIRFTTMPELLRVPPTVARIDLVLSGQRVEVPRRNEEGMLWLERRGKDEEQEGHFELEVQRRLDDGVPFRTTTRITIRAAGQPREVTLGRPILGDATPTELQSTLAVRLHPSGELVAQIHAGSHEIVLISHRAAPPEQLGPIAQPEPWPSEEIWVWVPNEALRQVEVGGAPSIDPARTNLPDDWRGYPAYVLSPERGLEFTTTRRGEPSPPPNQLSLTRELWLDLDGNGYTARDRVSGTMHQGFRLGLTEGDLGHVVLHGDDRLITVLNDIPGVEVRQSDVDMLAEFRLEGPSRDIPAVGWTEDMQSVSASLHLPPGWMLVGVAGVDEAPGTWLDQWNLWGIFFVLLVSVAIGRLIGLPAGVLAFVTLGLCYHEVDAPLGTWVAVIVLFALLKVLPDGWVAKTARFLFGSSVVLLLALALPFAADQLRHGLYPFTAPARAPYVESSVMELGMRRVQEEEPVVAKGPATPGETAAMAPEPLQKDADKPEALKSGVTVRSEGYTGSYDVFGSGGEPSPQKRDKLGWVDPNAVVQTGPGIPSWSFRTFALEWSGPVDKGHRLTLYLLPPLAFRLLAFLRVLLLGALIAIVIIRRPRGPAPRRVRRRPASPKAAAAVASSILMAILSAPAPSAAEPDPGPSDARLEELRARLTRAPKCSPDCVLASEMRVAIAAERVIIDAVVHAAARAAYRLPGPSSSFVPDAVTVDGVPSSALAALDEGFLFLRLEPGQHRVHLEGPIPARDSLTLAFGEPPRSVEVAAPGWETEGLRADGQVAASIQLRRLIQQVGEDEVERAQLPSWLIFHRRFEIGVRWTVRSEVERITPVGAPVVVRVPLLPGESVTQATVQTEGNEAVVSLGRDDRSVSWTSVLEPRDQLSLAATEGERFSERWSLVCSPIWRCRTAGLAPVEHVQDGLWAPLFKPFPGDELTLHFSRPKPARGRSLTIDSAVLSLVPGVRMLKGTLELTVRASSGGTEVIVLPDKTRVQSLSIDGVARPVLQDKRSIRVTVAPGSQSVVLAFQQPVGLTPVFRAPKFEIGKGAVNAMVRVQVPHDRWLLWTSGPAWGAGVLFWPYLLLVLLVAVALGRSKKTPLRSGEWALLGLGLTQIDAWAALIVVGWFFAVAYRQKKVELPPLWFDVRQLGLVVYTLVALGCLYAAVHVGLLMQPEMQVVSAHGADMNLGFFVDRIDGTMPRPVIYSLPMWVWRVTMLLWALWLAYRLLAWARWGWSSFSEGGLWRRLHVRRPSPLVPAPTGPRTTSAPSASSPKPDTAESDTAESDTAESDTAESDTAESDRDS